MTTPVKNSIPGYVAGTWDIDPVHSDVSFTVRHMMVSKVRGRFATFSGAIVTGGDVTDSSVAASIDPGSIDTGNALGRGPTLGPLLRRPEPSRVDVPLHRRPDRR